MAKILLVEDDNNLREIYEARLMAEGYEIVAARDGEEALTVAMKEKPDLIISDVMMPKISGFDMLDILRSTEETKHAKVIMMTALSQAEDKARAEKLGADRYLVKSQVTLEDVAKVAKQVLEGDSPTPAAAPVAAAVAVAAAPAVVAGNDPEPEQTPQPIADPTPTPVVDTQAPEPVAAPVDPAPATLPPVAEPNDDSSDDSVDQPAEEPTVAPVEPVAVPEENTTAPVVDPPLPTPDDSGSDIESTPEGGPEVAPEESNRKKTIEPINNLNENNEAKLKDLLEKEKMHEEMAQGVQETIAKHEQAPVEPSKQADAITTDTPVAPPPPETTIDPNSIAL